MVSLYPKYFHQNLEHLCWYKGCYSSWISIKLATSILCRTKKTLQNNNLIFHFRGKITYYTHPPEKQEIHLSSEIVTEMAKEFDIDSLLPKEQNALKGTNNLIHYTHLLPHTNQFEVPDSKPWEGFMHQMKSTRKIFGCSPKGLESVLLSTRAVAVSFLWKYM